MTWGDLYYSLLIRILGVRKKLSLLALVLISLFWFPHSLARVKELGYDFPIYYEYAKTGTSHGWVYAEWVRWVFVPLTVIPIEYAFFIWYALLVFCWVLLVFRVQTKIWAVLISVYPMLLLLELGQITPVLALLCLWPWGAVVAGAVKPYCLVFVVLHIAARYLRSRPTPIQ